jgi:hypothetical protein
MLSSMEFYTKEAGKAQRDAHALTQEIAELRGRLEAETALRAERDRSRAQELEAVQEQLRAEQRREAEIEAARAEEVSALRHEIEQERRVATDQRFAHHRELVALREQLERSAAEGRARAQRLAALEAEGQQRRLAEEQVAAQREHIDVLERQVDEHRRLAAEQAIARQQDVAALRHELEERQQLAAHEARAHSHEIATLWHELEERQQLAADQAAVLRQDIALLRTQLEAERSARVQIEALRASEEQRLSDERDAAYQQLSEARHEAVRLAGELSGWQDYFHRLERTRWWKLRTAWLRLKGWVIGSNGS